MATVEERLTTIEDKAQKHQQVLQDILTELKDRLTLGRFYWSPNSPAYQCRCCGQVEGHPESCLVDSLEKLQAILNGGT